MIRPSFTQSESTPNRVLLVIQRVCSTVLMTGAVAFVAVYFVIAIIRVQYPFELEWMEGGSVAHVQQILDRRPLYAAPSLDFIPFNYTPLYYYVAAVPAGLLGNGFLPLRLVSLAASLACFILTFFIVYRRTSSTHASVLAAALLAATFEFTGSWFDIARSDSLFLAFLLASIYLLESPRRVVHLYVAPCLLFLSFFTKQTALFVAPWLVISELLRRRGYDRLVFALVFGGLVGVSTFALNALTDGWYDYYVFGLAAEHGSEIARFTRFWFRDLRQVYLALGFSLVAVLFPYGRPPFDARAFRDGLCLIGLILASCAVRIHVGAFDNVLMPMAAAVAIYFGIGFWEIRQRLQRIPAAMVAVVIVAGLQFLTFAYSPRYQVPTQQDRRAGEKLLQRISTFKGEVYWGSSPWYLQMLGKPMQAHQMALFDVVHDSARTDVTNLILTDIERAVDEHRYDAFVVIGETWSLRPVNFDRHYVLAESNVNGRHFIPVSGTPDGRLSLFVRRAAR